MPSDRSSINLPISYPCLCRSSSNAKIKSSVLPRFNSRSSAVVPICGDTIYGHGFIVKVGKARLDLSTSRISAVVKPLKRRFEDSRMRCAFLWRYSFGIQLSSNTGKTKVLADAGNSPHVDQPADHGSTSHNERFGDFSFLQQEQSADDGHQDCGRIHYRPPS